MESSRVEGPTQDQQGSEDTIMTKKAVDLRSGLIQRGMQETA